MSERGEERIKVERERDRLWNTKDTENPKVHFIIFIGRHFRKNNNKKTLKRK